VKIQPQWVVRPGKQTKQTILDSQLLISDSVTKDKKYLKQEESKAL
jgi:hypothetical protein